MRGVRAVEEGVQRIHEAADASREVSGGITQQVGVMEVEVRQTRDVLDVALRRSESVLGVSERLMDHIASCGVHTADTPYIEQAQNVAARISAALVYLKSLKPEQLDGSEDKTVVMQFSPTASREFKGQAFLTGFALPNFFFHTTTAYAILRHCGAGVRGGVGGSRG